MQTVIRIHSTSIIKYLTLGQSCFIFGTPGSGVEDIEAEVIKDLESQKLKFQKVSLNDKNPKEKEKGISILNSNSLKEIKDISMKNKPILLIANRPPTKKMTDENDFNHFINISSFSYFETKLFLKNKFEKISPKQVKEIYKLTGGHQGLLESILKPKSDLKALLRNSQIKAHLDILVDTTLDLEVEECYEIGLVKDTGKLFSELLIKYLETYEYEGLDVLFPELTETDRQIFSIFIKNPNKVISKEQVSLIINQSTEPSSQWAIYKAVERMKKKIENRYVIRMLKGEGWKFVPKN